MKRPLLRSSAFVRAAKKYPQNAIEIQSALELLTVGMKSIAGSKPDAHSTFLNRQPEHVEIAGAFGLGEWDEKKVEIKRFNLA